MKSSLTNLKPAIFNGLEDDGLITPEVGSWANRKYKLIKIYSETFSNAMRLKWDTLIYIDLYAGSGRSKIEGSSRIVLSSPLIAMESGPFFNKFIFCEADSEKCEALLQRSKKLFSEADVQIINDDANTSVNAILSSIPKGSKSNKVLSFCFIDPYKLDNFDFTTIERLSKVFIDFMILIPSGMDASRNQRYYLDEKNVKLDKFIGSSGWREKWNERKNKMKPFEEFIVEEFNTSMIMLGYKDPGIENCIPIRSDQKKLLLYRLALYSRHSLGQKFWKIAKQYSDRQMELF